MAKSSHHKCPYCGSNDREMGNYKECIGCTAWIHDGCGGSTEHFFVANKVGISVYTCRDCKAGLARIGAVGEKDNKLFMLGCIYKQMQKSNKIQLSGNKVMHDDVEALRGEIRQVKSALDEKTQSSCGSNLMQDDFTALRGEIRQVKSALDEKTQSSCNTGMLETTLASMQTLVAAQNTMMEGMRAMMETQNKLLAEKMEAHNKMA